VTGFDAQEELETVLLPASRVPELLDSGQVAHALVQGALEAFSRKCALPTLAVQGPRSALPDERTEDLLLALEAQQTAKVIDLARRLHPGLTLEDVRNPHDFPELGDPDWQYEDGVLTGIQAALAAVRARAREGGSRGGA
jgi:hypothetical protein